jgi:Cofilin/tropomyosin-type actin-binding protein
VGALDYDAEGGVRRCAILFILWAPDDALIKEKMLYTSSKADFKSHLAGIDAEFQGTEWSELEEIPEMCVDKQLGEIISAVKSANKR